MNVIGGLESMPGLALLSFIYIKKKQNNQFRSLNENFGYIMFVVQSYSRFVSLKCSIVPSFLQ